MIFKEPFQPKLFYDSTHECHKQWKAPRISSKIRCFTCKLIMHISLINTSIHPSQELRSRVTLLCVSIYMRTGVERSSSQQILVKETRWKSTLQERCPEMVWSHLLQTYTDLALSSHHSSITFSLTFSSLLLPLKAKFPAVVSYKGEPLEKQLGKKCLLTF